MRKELCVKAFIRSVLRELRIYCKLMRIHLLSGVEYKGWWLMLIQVFISVVTDPISTVLLFSRFGSIGSWGVEQILLIYALAVACFGLAECFCRGFDYFPWQIRKGNFDRVLLRPCSLFIQVAGMIFHIHRFARPLTALAVVFWALRRLGVSMDALRILVLCLALLGGSIMYCGVFIFTSGLAFFTIKGLDWIYILTNASYQVTRCPDEYMPRMMKNFFTFCLPVLVVSYYPASYLCGWGASLFTGLLALPVGVGFLCFSLLVWQFGVRHYKSTGS